ncbi:MAG: SH3 domain-containing protein [Candidatus Fermentibacteraceae bacterium]|nr:SH3 domain-containing protein [Candidatus Fermentibacteraceae bacterium]
MRIICNSGAICFFISLILLTLCCSKTEVSLHDQETPGGIPSWQMLIVSGSVVNLRAGPGTEYAILGQVESGDTLQITGGLDNWFRVYVSHKSLFAWIYGPLTSGAELPH